MTREPLAYPGDPYNDPDYDEVAILKGEIERLRDEVERLKAAIAWTREVRPGKTREGCAVVEMTWDQFNAMRALADAEPKP